MLNMHQESHIVDINNFAAKAGWEDTTVEKIAPYWQELCNNTDHNVPFFAEYDFYSKALEMAGAATEEILSRIAGVAAILKKEKDLARFAAMLHYGFFLSPTLPPLGELPEADKFFGTNSGIFQLLIALSSLPIIRKKYAQMGVPEEFVRGAAAWIGGTVPIYAAAHKGVPGHSREQTFWLRFHADGKLFRIGRLEFLADTIPEWMPAVYVDTVTGETAVLARDQWRYDANGWRCLFLSTPAVFTASLRTSNGFVYGTAINGNGIPATDKTVALDLKRWQPLCSPWDIIPTVHIPGGGGLTRDKVKESITEAFSFFRKYLNTEVKAFVCNSWLLNTEWQQELPGSNIALFQQTGIMCSQEISANSGLFFVYGSNSADPLQEPAPTSLHKAFRNLAANGKCLRNGVAMFLPTCEQ